MLWVPVPSSLPSRATTLGRHHLGVLLCCNIFFFECLSVCLVSEATHWRTVSSKTRGIHPNGQLLRQAGPSSVAAEPPLPEKADRQSERQVGRQANRAASAESRAEQETGALPEHSNRGALGSVIQARHVSPPCTPV